MPKVSTNTLCVYIIYKHYICNIQDGLIWAPVSDTHRSISSIYHHFVSMQQVISVHREISHNSRGKGKQVIYGKRWVWSVCAVSKLRVKHNEVRSSTKCLWISFSFCRPVDLFSLPSLPFNETNYYWILMASTLQFKYFISGLDNA